MASCHLLIPVKRMTLAKSRLGEEPRRADLALAFAADVFTAATRCPDVAAVTVVTDDVEAAALAREMAIAVVADPPSADLNAALRHGAEAAHAPPGCWLGALSADLPALRPDDLTGALREAVDAASPAGAFVPDRDSGTTLLLRPPGLALDPAFGVGSRWAHSGSGAVAVGLDLVRLRTDVDTAADLAAAVLLGVGTRTRIVVAALEDPSG